MTVRQEDDERRFMQLETKVAYQDKLIAELNEVVIQRTYALDALTRRLEAIEKLLREPPGEPGPANEKPPHY
jgi:SlyX protein